MHYLLDTNHISALINDPDGACATRIHDHGDAAFTSIIVVAEIRFGLAKTPSERLQRLTEGVIGGIRVEPWDSPADSRYGEIRAYLEKKGTPIGGNDLFIAAHALSLDATVATANEREFRRVPGLRVENWIA